MRTDEIIRWVKGPRVLDVGCAGLIVAVDSPYWLHGRLRSQFPDVTGIDISHQNILAMRKNDFDKIYVQSAEEFSFQEKFDTIVAGELIEHLANPGLFLERAKYHLANGGRVILTTPYPFSLMLSLYALFKFPKTCPHPEHTCWFCPQTLRALVERYGFTVMHFELVEDYRPEDTSSRKYRLFVRLIGLFGRLIPKRLRSNAMLFVLERDEHPPHP